MASFSAQEPKRCNGNRSIRYVSERFDKCFHCTGSLLETAQKPIRYNGNMVLMCAKSERLTQDIG